MKKNKILMMTLIGVMCGGDVNASGGGFGQQQQQPLQPQMSPNGGAMIGPQPAQTAAPKRFWGRSAQEQGSKQQSGGFFGLGGKDSKRECKDAATLANKAQTCGDPVLKQIFMDGSAKLNALCERKPMRNPAEEARRTAKKLRDLSLKSNNSAVYTEIADSLDSAVTGMGKGVVMGGPMTQQPMAGQGGLSSAAQRQQVGPGLQQQPGTGGVQGMQSLSGVTDTPRGWRPR